MGCCLSCYKCLWSPPPPEITADRVTVAFENPMYDVEETLPSAIYPNAEVSFDKPPSGSSDGMSGFFDVGTEALFKSRALEKV